MIWSQSLFCSHFCRNNWWVVTQSKRQSDGWMCIVLCLFFGSVNADSFEVDLEQLAGSIRLTLYKQLGLPAKSTVQSEASTIMPTPANVTKGGGGNPSTIGGVHDDHAKRVGMKPVKSGGGLGCCISSSAGAHYPKPVVPQPVDFD